MCVNVENQRDAFTTIVVWKQRKQNVTHLFSFDGRSISTDRSIAGESSARARAHTFQVHVYIYMSYPVKIFLYLIPHSYVKEITAYLNNVGVVALNYFVSYDSFIQLDLMPRFFHQHLLLLYHHHLYNLVSLINRKKMRRKIAPLLLCTCGIAFSVLFNHKFSQHFFSRVRSRFLHSFVSTGLNHFVIVKYSGT